MPPKWGSRKGEVLRGDEPQFPEVGEAFPNSKTRHGTASGWSKHVKDETEICNPCAQAKAAYDFRRLSAPEEVVRNRLHAKAQGRANTILRRRHPEEFAKIYDSLVDEYLEEAGLARRFKRYRREGVDN